MSYTPRTLEALKLVMDLHHDQKRKGTDIPYITHLWAVAAIVGDCSLSVSFRTHWLANDGDPRASGFGDIEITSTRCLPPGGRS